MARNLSEFDAGSKNQNNRVGRGSNKAIKCFMRKCFVGCFLYGCFKAGVDSFNSFQFCFSVWDNDNKNLSLSNFLFSIGIEVKANLINACPISSLSPELE